MSVILRPDFPSAPSVAGAEPAPAAGAGQIKSGDRVRLHSSNARWIWTGIVLPGGKSGMVRVLWSDGDWIGEIEPDLLEIIGT